MLTLWRTYSFYRRYGGRTWAACQTIHSTWLMR
jgi:hypothetical protein